MSFATATLAICEPPKLILHIGEPQPQNRLRLAYALHLQRSCKGKSNRLYSTPKEKSRNTKMCFCFLAMDDKKDIFVFFRLGLNCRVIKVYSFLKQSKSRTYYNIIILLLLIALHKEVMHSTISTASLFLIFVSVCTILLRILKYSLAL